MSQVLFRVDPRVKQRAVRRARQEGVPLGAVLKLATRAYANGDLHLGVTNSVSEIPNARTRKALAQIDRDIAAGKNLEAYDNVDSFIASLKRHVKSRQ